MLSRVRGLILAASLALAAGAVSGGLRAQEDVAPQPVDTAALPDIAPEDGRWAIRNPYRDHPEAYARAQEIGRIAFERNCSRCHGHDAVSAGIIPDLRYLDPKEAGDEWFISRFRHGLKRDGRILMPPLGEALGQKTGWAIRSWLDMRYRK